MTTHGCAGSVGCGSAALSAGGGERERGGAERGAPAAPGGAAAAQGLTRRLLVSRRQLSG